MSTPDPAHIPYDDPTSPPNWPRDKWGAYLERNLRKFRKAIVRQKHLNPDDQDDVSQAIALTIWRDRGKIDPNRKLFPYLYGIALHVAGVADRANRRRLIRGLSSPLLSVDIPEKSQPTFEDQSTADDRANAVRQYISTLPLCDRTIIQMRYYGRLPWDVIAKAVGRSLASVHRAHRRLLAGAQKPLAKWQP